MTTVAIDARFAVGERRGIGKGSLELLRSLVQLDAPLFYELLVDRGGNEALIDAREAMGSTGIGDGIAIPHHVQADARHPRVHPAAEVGGVLPAVRVDQPVRGEMVRLDSLLPSDGAVRRRMVRAELLVPQPSDGSPLVLSTCDVNGALDSSVIAQARDGTASRDQAYP